MKASKHKDEVLCFELPLRAQAPQLINPDKGIARVTARGKHCYSMDVTVIDTPDARLLRAGVVLAHRISDGVGEWYFSAPSWRGLPDEAVELVSGTAELPERFAVLSRPLRRGALVGPIAALSCERREYALKNEHQVTIGIVRDDQVSVRSAGVVVSRYREASLRVLPGMSELSRAFVVASLVGSSAKPVHEFPRLQSRIGAPTTGLTDFPDPGELSDGVSLSRFVQYRFASRLHDVVKADLRLLSGRSSAKGLALALAATGRDVRGLAHIVEPGWREWLEGELAVLSHIDPSSRRPPLQTQELMDVIDALVSAARAPKVGDSGQRSAASEFLDRWQAGTLILIDRCRSLRVDSADSSWVAALLAAEQLQISVEVGADLHPVVASRFMKRLGALLEELSPGAGVVEEPAAGQVAAMSPIDAYAHGRKVATQQCQISYARKNFVESWPRYVKGMAKLVKRG